MDEGLAVWEVTKAVEEVGKSSSEGSHREVGRRLATMGQVCFSAISSNCACHKGLHCSESSVPAVVL